MRRNLVAEIMAEHIIYGGLLCTRGEAYEHALRATRDHRAADMFSCGPRAEAVDPEQHRGRLTLAQAVDRGIA